MTKKKNPEAFVVDVIVDIPDKAADLIIAAQVIHDKMAENVATFPAPDPPLTQLQALIDQLRADAAGAPARGIGGADHRNSTHTLVVTALKSEKAYVEKVANTDRKNAALIASKAGMRLKSVPVRNKPILELRNGPTAGVILAIAKAVKGATMYYWQYSLDGGVTWLDLPMTSGANTDFTVAPKATVHVRFHAFVRKTGHANWSNPESIVAV